MWLSLGKHWRRLVKLHSSPVGTFAFRKDTAPHYLLSSVLLHILANSKVNHQQYYASKR